MPGNDETGPHPKSSSLYNRLLDLACGRGGDMWKWLDAGLSYVKGYDLSPGEISEAE